MSPLHEEVGTERDIEEGSARTTSGSGPASSHPDQNTASIKPPATQQQQPQPAERPPPTSYHNQSSRRLMGDQTQHAQHSSSKFEAGRNSQEQTADNSSDTSSSFPPPGTNSATSSSGENSNSWQKMTTMSSSDREKQEHGVPTPFHHMESFIGNRCRILWMHKYIAIITLLLFGVLLGAGIAICSVLTNAKEEELRDEALGLAEETGVWFSDQLDKAILPLFSLAQFASELDVFRSLSGDIGQMGTEGALPMVTEPIERIQTHRNVSGVCDAPALVERFDEIASVIKRNAKMQGILVNLQFAPMGVVCLLHPLNNTEDFPPGVWMDNNPARGLDLFEAPTMKFIAETAIKQDEMTIAGPLRLMQCAEGCNAQVEQAFIVRLPISMPEYEITVDGQSYPRWGFATALINWEALVVQSGIYESFADLNTEFQLTRTDRKYDATSDSYQNVKVVLAETANYAASLERANMKLVSTDLQTTNNMWEISVAYEDDSDSMRAWVISACAVLALIISFMICTILTQKHTHLEMLSEAHAQSAKVETERNMTAYFAHELRNPLGAIDSALQSMPDDVGPKAKELISGMMLCTQFMTTIMNNLLDVRKMEEGKMLLQFEMLSLRELVETVHQMLLPAVKPAVQFSVDCQTTSISDWVLGDYHRLQQVLTNVVNNAIKYTQTGSIILRVAWKGKMVVFEVVDTGPGIPKNAQKQLFERFVQRGGAPGTGLGLAISKHVVEIMKGTIRFESDPSVKRGTNCVISLPLEAAEPPSSAELSIPAPNLPIQKELSLLIIDDIRMNRTMLKHRFLKGVAPNSRITEASTGEEALELVEKDRFDVILVDQYMGEAGGVMLGTDVTIAMRRMNITSLIIGCSGNELDHEFREAGADDVWQKPIPSNDAIIGTIRSKLNIPEE